MGALRGKSLFGVIGNPVRGSLAPTGHNGAFRHLGMDAVCRPFELNPEARRPVLSAVPHRAFTGLNVPVPCKEKILRHPDEATDGPGFVTALKAEGGVTRNRFLPAHGFPQARRGRVCPA